MSDNHQKYWTIGAIVDQMIIDNSLSEHFFAKFLSWALWGYRELQFDVYQDTETCLLEVSDLRTVTMPGNYVDFCVIGALRGQYVIGLAKNDSLSRLKPSGDVKVRGLLSQNLPNGIEFNSYSGGYFFNGSGSGAGLPNARSFNIVKRDGFYQVDLDVNFTCDHLYVEYISDGFKPCGETVVNPLFADYILKYLETKWESKLNPNRTISSIRDAKSELWAAEKIVRGRVNSISMQDFQAISRTHTRLTPKI